MRSLPVFAVLLALLTSAAFGQGWVGQEQVSGSDASSGQPTIAFDPSGRPWAVWHGYWEGGSLQFSRWLGDHWDEWRRVGPDLPSVLARFRPCLASDGQGQAWLVWDNVHSNNTDDIGSSCWAETCWTSEVQVNLPDSTELDFAPKVACGGGQVWCVWYGGPISTSSYSVFASRWDSSAGAWEPETQVSPPDGNNHWWCDVAVDSQGTPHVVWTETEHVAIYHSFYNGLQWSEPALVNDSSRVRAASWAAPRVVIDRDGILHVCFTGVLLGTSRRDVFYTRNDGSGWIPSVRVTQDTAYNYNEWYSGIAADRPDNVWVVWDRQDEGPDQFRVYASHYDGHEWSSEERLDDTSSYYDAGASVSLDPYGFPWVVWEGEDYGSGARHVFCNRYGWVGVSEAGRRPQSDGRPGALTWRPLATGAEFRYGLAAPARVELTLFDGAGRVIRTLVAGYERSGRHAVRWDGRGAHGEPVASGTYFCRLATGGFSDVCKVAFVTTARQRR